MSLSEKIISISSEKNITLAVAESVTGGKISSELISVSGSSKVFTAGVICYSEHSKVHSCGVDIRLINKVGVYDEAVVQQMAERIAKRNIADIGIATSGCAETADGNCEAGKIYFAFSQRGKETQIYIEKFSGSREEIQKNATKFALETVKNIIEKI